jgi:catechol 2,3-dioxygenase
VSDIAHLGPVELFTPKGDESLRFFVDVMGMEIEHEDGAATYLRGWGDYQPWSLKLIASDTSGMGVLGLRAASRDALKRRVAAVEATGLGEGWVDGDRGRGRGYRFRDPDGHRFELYYDCERYDPPAHLRPSLKNVPGRYTARGCAVTRLDHVNVLAADVRANREFCVDALTYRLYERIELDDGSEAGAWMSASIAAHELIYTRDAHAANGRLHHLAFWVDTRDECLRAADIWLDAGIEIEAAPSKHAIAQGFFLYGIEPGGNRVEVTTGGRLVYAPDEPCVVWTEAERAKGQAWGVKTVESFHTYGTPPVGRPRS